MKQLLIVFPLLLVACGQPTPVSFAERAARAEALENTPTGMAYVTQLLREHGEKINKFAGECYSTSSLQKDAFKLVADIDPHGKLVNVAVQPETSPTRCYAGKVAQLQIRAARPMGFTDKPFPLVINVHYNK